MNQQEQARIQVLTVLEYQLPIAQAAEIMGVASATPSASSRLTARSVLPHWPTGTGAADPTMLSLRSLRLPW